MIKHLSSFNDGYKACDLLFVYGSLKKGSWNNHVLGDAELLGDYVTAEAGWMTNVGFPYMIFSGDIDECGMRSTQMGNGCEPYHQRCASGELYYTKDRRIKRRLDLLEGEGSHYRRRSKLVRPVLAKCYSSEIEATIYTPCDIHSALMNDACGEEKLDSEGYQKYWKWTG
jgi:gamma-glutamylcyclotransferase (GGCT)/AIG2-like uncharacterized protein YtfP